MQRTYEEYQDIRVLYQVQVDHTKRLKQQQWTTAYYYLLLLGGLVAFSKLFFDICPLATRIIFSILIFTLSFFSCCLICKLQKDLAKARERMLKWREEFALPYSDEDELGGTPRAVYISWKYDKFVFILTSCIIALSSMLTISYLCFVK